MVQYCLAFDVLHKIEDHLSGLASALAMKITSLGLQNAGLEPISVNTLSQHP